MELIKGRWYKCLGERKDHIGKFSGWHSLDIISVSEYIYEGRLRGPSKCFTRAYKFAEEVPLSEIQQYLPEGHPDKEFVLPEKWCVETTASNVDALSKWRGNEDLKYGEIYGYLHSDLIWRDHMKGSTEITFEQFKKYVLKTKEMEEREIIGYKLKENCKQYEEAVLKIMNANWGEPKYSVTASWCIRDLRRAGVLELWFEPIYREEFKVGDWVTWIDGTTGRIVKHCKSFADSWSLDVKGDTEQYNSCSESNLRLATPEEIKKTLVEEAVKRGFKEGVKVRSLIHNKDLFCNNTINGFEYYSDYDKLHFGSDGVSCVVIYEKGKWAEILPSYPQIEINGYKGEFFDNYVKFGCAEISKEVFIDLAKCREYKNTNRDIESATIGKGTFSKDQIKLIAEYYLNKK